MWQRALCPGMTERPHPKLTGDIAETRVLAALVARGKMVLRPWSENARFDFVVYNEDETFTRIQCKTGRLRKGVIIFATRSTGVVRRSYHGEIDCFAVYCPETDKVYMIPIADLPAKSNASLRVDEPKNNQANGVRWAKDYELK